METATLSRDRSSSTSSTRPLKEAKGPSATRTVSPTSKLIVGRGRSGWLDNKADYAYPQYLADMNALIARDRKSVV